MTSRAYIVKVTADGQAADLIECYHYGNLAYTGMMLLEHYHDPARVDRLVALGDLVHLGETLSFGTTPFWHYTESLWRDHDKERRVTHLADFAGFHRQLCDNDGFFAVDFTYLMVPDAAGRFH